MIRCKDCKFLCMLCDEVGEKYNWCFCIEDSPGVNIERKCEYYSPATNVDRIRNMDDEELAEMFNDLCSLFSCNRCTNGCQNDCQFDDEEYILEWLQSEVV